MKSIRWKITLSYLGLAAITLVITGVLLLIGTRVLSRRVQESELRQTAIEILPEMRDLVLTEDDPARVRELIQVLQSAAKVEITDPSEAGATSSQR